jgi:hypothetical protein
MNNGRGLLIVTLRRPGLETLDLRVASGNDTDALNTTS